MEWQFDIRTAVAVCSFMTLLVDGMLLAVFRGLPQEYRSSLRWWLAGSLLQPVGLVLLCLRDVLPNWLSIVGANTLLALALSCTAIALRVFYGVAERRQRLYVITALTASISIFFTYVEPSLHWRLILSSALLAILIGSSARAIFRHDGPAGLIPRLTGIVFAIGTVLMIYRGVNEIFSPVPAASLFKLSMAQNLTFGLLGFLPVISTVGFLLMCTERSQQELSRAARLDYLTGIFNRRAIEDLAQRAIAAARRHGMSLAMLVIDLDHFKRINDEFGHEAGDQALIETVRRIRDSLRTEDLVGRLGGEEFIAVMPNTDGGSALAAAERLRCSFSDAPMQIDGSNMQVTVSVGVAMLMAEDLQFSHLLRRADRAMYAAKSAGRDKVMLDGASP